MVARRRRRATSPESLGEHRELDGARAVGDRRDDLHRRPEARSHATSRRRAGRVRGTRRSFPGYRIGMCRSTSDASDDDGIVDDLQAGSSPTSATAPPSVDDPANTPCRSASPARSSPGRLAVPDPDHAVVASVGSGRRELRSHHRRGAELFVDRRSMHDRQLGRPGRWPARLPGRSRRAATPGTPTAALQCAGRPPGRDGAVRSGCGRAPGSRSATPARRSRW